MFTNDSTENLLDNLEQELIEIESPKNVEPVAKDRKNKESVEPPTHKTNLINVFEEPPKPQARERNIFVASSSKSLEKSEKNDENEIIQLSSISSDILRSSQSSPTLTEKKNHSQASSYNSAGQPNSSVVMINEKKKSRKIINVQVVHEANADSKETESFFVIKHGKWANDDAPKNDSPKPLQTDDNKITVENEAEPEDDEEGDEKPKKIEKSKKLKIKKPSKKVNTSSSSVTTSLHSSTLSSSSEEELPPIPIKKKQSKSKGKKLKEKMAKKKSSKKKESVDDEELKSEESSGESIENPKEILQEIENTRAIGNFSAFLEFQIDFLTVFSGIYIHETGKLEYNTNLKQPRIKVSFYNEDNGNLIQKTVGKSPIDTLFSKKGTFNDDYL